MITFVPFTPVSDTGCPTILIEIRFVSGEELRQCASGIHTALTNLLHFPNRVY